MRLPFPVLPITNHTGALPMKATLTALAAAAACALATSASAADVNDNATTTPIKHVIVVVGENHTFDSLFATYQPAAGQSVRNLLSEGIVKADGSAGANYAQAQQSKGSNPGSTYTINPNRNGSWFWLPQPILPQPLVDLGLPDLRFPFWLADGPFQITSYASYNGLDSITGDPVHRFFQMWQQTGGTNVRHDMFVWTATTTGQGGNTTAITSSNTGQGGELMGFYNMAAGDAPYFKKLANTYAISDNYHQSIMGGTGMNFFELATGDLPVYNVNGMLATPPANQIENPNPTSGTTNFFQQDGYSGGSWVNCSDLSQPGVAAIRALLVSENVPHNCAAGTWYLVNNYNPPYDSEGNAEPLGASNYNYPPQTVPTIGEALSSKHVSWKWYTGGRIAEDATINVLGQATGGLLGDLFYNELGDPLNGSKNVVGGPLRANLQPMVSFLSDVKNQTLPAVSFVVPDNMDAGHPANSAPSYYEGFLQGLVQMVQAQPALWADTAIVITTDEGGGYFDTGHIQQLDFFGDGPRIPLIVVSPYAKKGYVDHVYHDHASILKFIEHNWQLPALSNRSRDRLPNPVMNNAADPYLPSNSPAIGDLSTLFAF